MAGGGTASRDGGYLRVNWVTWSVWCVRIRQRVAYRLHTGGLGTHTDNESAQQHFWLGGGGEAHMGDGRPAGKNPCLSNPWNIRLSR